MKKVNISDKRNKTLNYLYEMEKVSQIFINSYCQI